MDPNTQEDYFWNSYNKLTATEKAIFRKLLFSSRVSTPCSNAQNLFIEFMQLPTEARRKIIIHFANIPVWDFIGVDWSAVSKS